MQTVVGLKQEERCVTIRWWCRSQCHY